MYELSRLIPQEHFPKDILEIDKARLRVKIEKEWANYKYQHPEETRGGYSNPTTMYDKSLWENQLAWREKWIRKRRNTLKIYYNFPRDMRIDPPYCPTECR